MSLQEKIDQIKFSEFCVPDSGTAIFVLPDGKQIELNGTEILEALCDAYKIKIEWEFG